MNDAPLPPAGWYPDPEGGSGTRFWDGSAWTTQVNTAPVVPPPPPAAPTYPSFGASGDQSAPGDQPAYGSQPYGSPAYGTPAYGAPPAANTTGLWVGGIICGLIAIVFCPILLGPTGIALGGVAVSKGDQKGWIAVGVATVGMIVGFVIGAMVFRSNFA